MYSYELGKIRMSDEDECKAAGTEGWRREVVGPRELLETFDERADVLVCLRGGIQQLSNGNIFGWPENFP